MSTLQEGQAQTMPRVLTIAGSDSGGGAGIQADLKTFAALGVYGMSAITSVTAQNTTGVQGVSDLPPEFVGLQIESVVSDIGVDGVKTGMLPSAGIIEVVADKVREHALPHLVVDPMMVAGSGELLLQPEAREALVELLLPLAEVLTPNLYEARALTGLAIEGVEDMRRAAETIHALGPRYVVVKGGHLEAEPVDLLYDGQHFALLQGERIVTPHTHGTGCTFASAIAAGLAKGLPVEEAVREAKGYITEAIRHALPLGHGHGPVDHFAALYQATGRCRRQKLE
ncbi:MAG: bifunctional hydroxymethylpyrimidine kinase/phosphomethylpyrimidine kinase [Chloroflexota bacterium]|nr:bifunctional hydroxymethylpyrimidine kinase/phosphomethylpyrimidine kinase [Chloroflexota bacterium]